MHSISEMKTSPYPNSSEKMRSRANDQSGSGLSPSQQKSDPLNPTPSTTNSRTASTLDKAVEYELKYGHGLDPNMDTKKLRRIVSNRLSAHRARQRRDKYITELEKRVSHLQETVSTLVEKVESYKENVKLLMLQNQSLQRLIEIRSDEANCVELELGIKRMELSRLRLCQEQVASSAFVQSPTSGFEVDQYLNLEG